ncbi:MAG: calcium/sodium antiporter [Oceanipulchritudo sp.]
MTTLLLDLLSCVAGLLLLYFGAELLVRASVSIGLRVGLSRLVIGLTIVSFSTSAPEIVISSQAAWKGQGDIAMGNVLGSNLANIGLILGLSACLCPLAVHFRSIRLDGPVMVATTLLAGVMAWDGQIGRLEGAILLFLLVFLIIARIRIERAEAVDHDLEFEPERPWSPGWAIGGLILGLLLLATGGDWLVSGSIAMATRFNVPEAFIAVTVVAIGTSLPELSTSIVAAFRGNADIAVGNVLGSNIFNACGVLGLAAVIQPLQGAGFHTEIIATTFMGLGLLPLLRSGFRVERWEGFLLVLVYGAALILVA